MKKYLKIFSKINYLKFVIYLSLPFLLLVLYKFDYFLLPRVLDFSSLIISFVFLFVGFILMSENWRNVLKFDKIVSLPRSEAIKSSGLTIFTKYIPGKVLSLLSRSLYVHNKYNLPLKKLIVVSLKTQLISIWMGLMIGGILLIEYKFNLILEIIYLSFLLVFCLFLISHSLKKKIGTFLSSIFYREIVFPSLRISELFRLVPSFFLTWVSWCLGFYFLINSILDYEISYLVGFSFALASTISILTLIAPGGLGVREGILLSLLLLLGIKKQDAITISIISRMWFIIGEIFIFCLAFLLDLLEKRKISQN